MSNSNAVWRERLNKEQRQYTAHSSFSLNPDKMTIATERPHKRALQRTWGSMVTSHVLPGGSDNTWSAAHNQKTQTLQAITSPTRKFTSPYASPTNADTTYATISSSYGENAHQATAFERRPQPTSDISRFAHSYTVAQGFSPFSRSAHTSFVPVAGLA